MENSYQELYMHFAIWVAVFAVVYLLIAFNIGKNTEDKEQAKEQIRLNRMKRDYFQLKQEIEICCIEEELMVFEVSIDQYFERYHQSGKNNTELLQYYTFLLRGISEKRNEFKGIQEVTV